MDDGTMIPGDGTSIDPTEEETPEQEEHQITVQDSILLLTKKKLGIAPDYHAFDEDVITDINTILFTLNQVGIGPEGFEVVDEKQTWNDFLGTDIAKYNSVKSYIFLKVRLMFDPPTSSFVLAALEKQASELEWRLNLKYEVKSLEPNQNDSSTEGGVEGGTNTI